MDTILLEIRAHLEEAKDEITILQHQFEQRLLKQSAKLDLNYKNRDRQSPFRSTLNSYSGENQDTENI